MQTHVCGSIPVGRDAREIEDEIVIDLFHRCANEALLDVICPDRTRSRDCLAEVNVDRGPRRRLDALQLTRRRNVESLQWKY